MSKLNYKTLIKLLFIILVYRSLATDRQMIFNVSYWDKYIFTGLGSIMLLLCLLIQNEFKLSIPKRVRDIFLILLLPIIIVWCYSLVTTLIIPVGFSGYNTRSISYICYNAFSALNALLVFLFFKDEAVNISFIPYCLSFFTSVIVSFVHNGFNDFYRMLFDDTFNGSVLEMSELLPAIGIFLIYYLFQFSITRNNDYLKRIVVCLIILTIGTKRIIIISILIIFVLYFFLKKKASKTILSLEAIIGSILILVMYVFIYLIKSEYLFYLLSKYNVNTMSRTPLWLSVKHTYEFSPFFIGRGLGYVTLWIDNNWSTIDIIGLKGSIGLHNDVLRQYIDMGFWGFAIYYFYYLIYLPRHFFNIVGKNSSLIIFSIIVYETLCCFTDNVSGYHVFLWPMYLAIFLLAEKFEEVKYNDIKGL